MLADLRRAPWRARTHALTLARLHRELHAIPPPDSLHGEGASILHLDLHPANVMLTLRGPVIIDWANAARGDAALDVALAAVVLAGAPVGPPVVASRSIRTGLPRRVHRSGLARQAR
jgi:Ser/Thr protein kinase RdoA (MazF antagonist)